ncbi:MAG: 4Fe-4S dicluster domain-containing protein [Syntrophales bacterium]|nr:4Fe-4S dicluster domain-containing protein [Syntrophales bacterium]MCK9391869.1 4Fe-4S dicluster domain-containing protein [Syntrophales bacterium]
MIEPMDLKAKLGMDVFKSGGAAHIKIRTGKGKDPRLQKMAMICPAGLYSVDEQGETSLTIDGCLECGTCRLVCGTDVLEWAYPEGGAGVQFRFG